MQAWKLDHTFTGGLDEKLLLFSQKVLAVRREAKTNNTVFGRSIGYQGGHPAQITTCLGLNGLLTSGLSLSFAGQQLALRNYDFSEYCIDFLCKVAVYDNARIRNFQRPFIAICQVLSTMDGMRNRGEINADDCYLSKLECQRYLFPPDDAPKEQYPAVNAELVRAIVEGRGHTDPGNLDWPVNDSWDAMLNFTKIITAENDTFRIREEQPGAAELANRIAYGDYNDPDDTVDLYDYYANKNTGISQILPVLENETDLLDMDERSAFSAVFSGELSVFRLIPGVVISSVVRDEMLRERLLDYYRRTRNAVRTRETAEIRGEAADDDTLFAFSPLKHNRIITGAPGTGKSYRLEQERKTHFIASNFVRVTFYPSYTYSQFAGSYKPTANEDGSIVYSYIPGPFVQILVKALKDPTNLYLLIVEELNRANAPAVFGDLFQLLDRLPDGRSEYPVTPGHDLMAYLRNEGLDDTSLSLPPNLYIWATMNSADQGVFPLDTAFRRRWDCDFIDINDNESAISSFGMHLGAAQLPVKWNTLRRAINERLIEFNVNEDKLLGPFFIGMKTLRSGDAAIYEAFKTKVLTYLFEDAARPIRARFFPENSGKTYSRICSAFDERGADALGLQIPPEDQTTD